jgi:hypothetical protein
MKLLSIILKIIRDYWWQILCFGLGVIAYAYQQALSFYYPYDNGFWSLHTHGSRFDAWHISGVVMLFFMVLGMIPRHKQLRIRLAALAVFGLANYILHEYFLHKVFKPKKGN